MDHKFEQHCGDDALEGYVLGTLASDELDSIDEHLLICESCRDKLDQTERYVHAMRSAATQLRAGDEQGGYLEMVRRWFARPAGIGVAAAAVLAILFVAVRLFLQPLALGAPVPVTLLAERGAPNSAPAHRILELTLDARGFDAATSARVELVGSSGNVIEAESAQPAGERIHFRISRNLDAGSYYVRLHGSAGLEREFALDLK